MKSIGCPSGSFLAPIFRRVLVLAFALMGHAAMQAADTGRITGQVRNAATGQFLQGAEIALTSGSASVLTARDGTFILTSVPSGSQSVRASYTGLDAQTVSVDVMEGGTARLEIALTSSVYTLDTFTVAGVREGNAASITQQRNADGVMNVVAMDAFGNVADGNIGNFLQRLPGVGAIHEVGDVVGIGVRGVPPEMNSVTMDGTTTAAASSTIYQAAGTQGERAVPIDQVPSDFIKEVQLIKALTPDMAATSVGGTVNLVTKSALDVDGTQMTYRAGYNQNTYRDDERKWTPTGSFTLLTKVGAKQNIGVALSGSYTETENGRDRIQMTRNQPLNFTSQARTLNDLATRIRSATSMKLNFRPTSAVDLSFGAAYTYYSFHQPRYDWNITAVNRVADYSRVSRAQIEAGAVPRDATNQTAGIAPGFSGEFTELLHATYASIGSDSVRHSRTYKIDAGADITLPADQSLTFKASFSPSEFQTSFQTVNASRSLGGIGVSVDSRADIKRPVYTQTYGPTIGVGSDFTAYTAAHTVSANSNEDEITSLRADYDKRWDLERMTLTFKSGLAWQRQDRKEAPYAPIWDYVGVDGVAGRNPATGINDDNIAQFVQPAPGYGVMNNLYPQRDALDFPKFLAFKGQSPGLFRQRGTTVSQGPLRRELTEDVSALYLMGTAQINKLRITGGIRGERSDVSALGQNRDPRNPAALLVTREGSYDDLFPSLHLRHEPTKNLILRASYSTGAARASFGDIYPNTTVTYNESTGLGTVTTASPELKPAYSQNYDLSIELYDNSAGVISAGYFHKDIDDFIARETSVIGTGTDNGFDGLYEGFNLNTTSNAGSATVTGFELNFVHQFAWLPNPFNSLSLFANYTEIDTEGSYASGAEELIRFVPKTSNVGLSGRYGKFEARLSYNFKDGYLYSYATNPDQRVRTSGVETWDFNVQYQFHRRLTVFADLVNAFNKWESWYTAKDPARVTMAEVYGTRLNIGISGRF